MSKFSESIYESYTELEDSSENLCRLTMVLHRQRESFKNELRQGCDLADVIAKAVDLEPPTDFIRSYLMMYERDALARIISTSDYRSKAPAISFESEATYAQSLKQFWDAASSVIGRRNMDLLLRPELPNTPDFKNVISMESILKQVVNPFHMFSMTKQEIEKVNQILESTQKRTKTVNYLINQIQRSLYLSHVQENAHRRMHANLQTILIKGGLAHGHEDDATKGTLKSELEEFIMSMKRFSEELCKVHVTSD
ncbi:hypothetical protein [Exiguobacterium sp. s193]|uniref:hypothetical protein n=1 Tax=Exiguobacterium sp. s193 TaxID=2751207 RepID=UPI001BE9886E|nr:hypothetical protein [Exiguobacterium sp. s193]